MSHHTQSSLRLITMLVIIVVIDTVSLGVMAQTSADAPSSGTRQSVTYVCPMHPEVRSGEPGNCIKCGVPLVATAKPPEIIEYKVNLETVPAAIKSGEQIELRFLITHPKTGEPVKQFNITYDKPFHLFIVSQDLEYYDHLHPTQQADGSFAIRTTLPKGGLYRVFSEFAPVGGTPQVIRTSLTTADGSHLGAHHIADTNLSADQSLTKSLEGIRFELKLAPAEPVAGQPTLLRYYLVDEKTGLPVKNLQPYLGAWGHTATISEDGTEFLHSHPTRLIPPGVDRSKLQSRPGISFHTFFPRPGNYRIWSQFQRENKVITVSFTISVSRLAQIAKWDGTNWSTLVENPMNGLNGTVRALAVSGSNLYVGGDFTTVDGLSASRIAKWDGHSWSALGAGVNGKVWAIAVAGSNVYVGGDFTTAGKVAANRIAKWDGSSWSALGDGLSECRDSFCVPTVYALAVNGSDLYAGGRFGKADGLPAAGIAKWDGRAWSALGNGVKTGIYDGIVKALVVRDKDVFVGGRFLTAGALQAYNVARWNGDSWFSLNGGIRGNMEEVLTLGLSNNDLYVGGTFNVAGGLSATNIAKWNGSAWSEVDVSSREGVRKIVAAGGNIYFGGGLFTLPNGAVTEGIVQWNGDSWSTLGNDFVNSAYAGPIMTIAMSGNELYIGGDSLIMRKQKTPHHPHH